ncbi:MAG TPA: hypothetical protein VFC24_07785 [Casimicrobiaceae bacterium]|nr:hypothetical protein [Casimicrobiaceae bacterium]
MSRQPNALRNEELPEWRVEDDYLAARGYPMTGHNRQVVRNILSTLPQRPERKELFRYLDARLFNREPAG